MNNIFLKNRLGFPIILLFFLSIPSFSQSLRGLVNDGVEAYENKKFADAEVNFKKGIENEVENFQANFNLGDALYKQGRYDEALESFKTSLALTEDPGVKSKAFHNIGNSFLKSQKYQESIAAYKEALKLNPRDLETKYNLSYALKMMQKQQDNQKQNKDDNQQNKDDKKDENKDKNQQNKDQDQNKDKQDQQQNDQKKEDQQQNDQQKQQPKPQNEEMSKDQAERILDALKNNEAELQKQMRQKKAKKSTTDKDW